MITLSSDSKIVNGRIKLDSSKSICNRLLIIQQLNEHPFIIENISKSEDTQVLQKILQFYKTTSTLDIGAAGTVMRFLTAFLSIQKGDWTLTGSERMKERPIESLVTALQSLGADINYSEKSGFPPINIIGKEIQCGSLSIDASISSQFITALLLIAPTLPKGLHIQLKGEINSKPYIEMTLKLMKSFGANAEWNDSAINILPVPYQIAGKSVKVEADWSNASYYYALACLSDKVELQLEGLQKDSLQGDAILIDLFEKLGVGTHFNSTGIALFKNKIAPPSHFEYDFSNCPDLAQTMAVVLAAKGIKSKLIGLKSLRIKETDRITALVTELNKLGFEAIAGTDFIEIGTNRKETGVFKICTYNDHRMAMAFAPLVFLFKEIQIENPEVVNKSYPDFWKDLQLIGIDLQ